MKQTNQTPATGRVRALFSSLTLATAFAFGVASCSKERTDEIKPSIAASPVTANATPKNSEGAYSHNIKVYVPNSRVRCVAVRVGDDFVRCVNVNKVGWMEPDVQVGESQIAAITLYYGTCEQNGGSGVYSGKYVTAPGNDGYSNLWVSF